MILVFHGLVTKINKIKEKDVDWRKFYSIQTSFSMKGVWFSSELCFLNVDILGYFMFD